MIVSPLLSWFFPSFFNPMTSFPLSILWTVGILLELYAIRSCPLSRVGQNINGDFSAPEVAHRFDWQEIVCLLSHIPDIICLLPFIFLPQSCFSMSRLMGEMSIEWNERSVVASSSDFPVAEHFAITWTPDSVICVLCFNGNINYSHYVRTSLTSKFQIDLFFDSWSINDLWKTIGSL